MFPLRNTSGLTPTHSRPWPRLCWLVTWALLGSYFLLKAVPGSPLHAEQAGRTRPQAALAQDSRDPAGSRTKNIEDIRAGERVMAFDHEAGTWQPCEVLATMEREYDGEMVAVTVGSDTIEATGNHPFWVVTGTDLATRPKPEHVEAYEAASTIAGRWVDARNILVGDELLLRSGETNRVSGVLSRMERRTVYNFQVADKHTYAVGKTHLLVHNRTFVDEMSPSEAARYRKYWAQRFHQEGNGTRFRDQAAPGTRSVTDQKLSSRTGKPYDRQSIYDEYGRRIGNNDHTDHGEGHLDPHHHTRDPVGGQRGGPYPGLHPQTPGS